MKFHFLERLSHSLTAFSGPVPGFHGPPLIAIRFLKLSPARLAFVGRHRHRRFLTENESGERPHVLWSTNYRFPDTKARDACSGRRPAEGVSLVDTIYMIPLKSGFIKIRIKMLYDPKAKICFQDVEPLRSYLNAALTTR